MVGFMISMCSENVPVQFVVAFQLTDWLASYSADVA